MILRSIANEGSTYMKGMERDYLNDHDSQATQQKKRKKKRRETRFVDNSETFSEKLNVESINKFGNRNCAMQLEGII